jgi:DNA-binding transcriptional regulator YdaS (Cro superfamily)
MSRLATEQAINAMGGGAKAARTLGVSRQAVWKWRQKGLFPIGQIILIEHLTGIPREDLRPDVFGAPRPRPTRSARASLTA